MNAPADKFLSKTRGAAGVRAEWRNAAGWSLDVLEPADRLQDDPRRPCRRRRRPRAAAEARAAQPAWAATPYERARRRVAQGRSPARGQSGRAIPWIARETGGIPAEARFEIHIVTDILDRSSAMSRTSSSRAEALPSDPCRILSLARRISRAASSAAFSPFTFPV